jgi:xanthine phosphoribosyltransferase
MKKRIINQQEFNGLVADICRQIHLSKWKPDYVVGITRGGLMPAVMISHYFNVPCETLKVSLRDGGEPESNLWMAEEALGHINYDPMCSGNGQKNILIVDDINDSGATLNWIMNDWPSGCFPDDPSWEEVWNNNVRFAVIVDNLASECNAPMDYVGFEINKLEEDVWIEFPYEDWWTK